MPPITRPLIARWQAFATLAGVSMLARTPTEQLVGAALLVAAFLLAAAFVTRHAIWALAGFGAGAVAAGARLVSCPWIPGITWHSVGIIVAAWGMFAWLMAERAAASWRLVNNPEGG